MQAGLRGGPFCPIIKEMDQAKTMARPVQLVTLVTWTQDSFRNLFDLYWSFSLTNPRDHVHLIMWLSLIATATWSGKETLGHIIFGKTSPPSLLFQLLLSPDCVFCSNFSWLCVHCGTYLQSISAHTPMGIQRGRL